MIVRPDSRTKNRDAQVLIFVSKDVAAIISVFLIFHCYKAYNNNIKMTNSLSQLHDAYLTMSYSSHIGD